MEGWKEVNIDDLGKVVTGNTPPRKNPELYGSHTLFIKPTDISLDTKYTYAPEECYSDLGYKKYKNSLIPKGATCVVTIGSIGKKMTKAHCDCFINQAVNAVIPFDNYDEDFVYYVLKFNLGRLKTFDSGTASGRENVSKSSFSSIKVNVPIELKVQKKIGQILSAYDDLIENNLKRIKLLEETAQRTYEEWFVKDEIPTNWNKVKIGELLAKTKSTKKISSTEFNSVGQYPIIDQSRDFIAGYTDDEDAIINSELPIIVFGDHTRILKFINFPFARGADGTQLIQSNNLKRMPQHLFYQSILNADLSNYHYTRHFKFLKELEILLPDEKLAKRFEDIAKPIFNLILNLTCQNRLFKEARDLLLPGLMTGAISVTTAEAKIISIAKPVEKAANWEFKEAVLIAVLTEKFGSEKYPLGRKRYTKLSYLFHRHVDNQIKNYLRKAAGPYNPKTKYQGPEKIAHQNEYVEDCKNGNLTGFVAGKNIAAAKIYFEKYWNIEYLDWLVKNFKYKSNDYLELYATVDNAMLELYENNKPINVLEIKQIIKTEKEWKAKLERDIFSDNNIQQTINFLPTIFQYQ